MLLRNIKNLILLLAISSNAFSISKYPNTVEKALQKSGKNKIELQKVLDHYRKDSLRFKAACFLFSNMDCHASQEYRWLDEKKQPIHFNEFDYNSYDEAVSVFKELSIRTKLTSQTFTKPDLNNLTAQYIISNIDMAFAVWKSKWNGRLPFRVFCEYILPYRIMDEPISEWRKSYAGYFAKPFVQCKDRSVRDVCTYLSENHKDWFADIFSLNIKKEPQHVLSAQQILFRRQGYCEDMSNWGVFMLRSLGIPTTVDFTPYWATSSDGHFWQVAFNEDGKEIPFFMGDDTPAEFFIRREPSKVLRLTFSKQKNTLAATTDTTQIPTGFLRMKNYLDVTNKYWKTSDITITLPENTKSKICFVAVYNGARWRTAWWARSNNTTYKFEKMTCGVVYLPMIYNNGKEKPASSPYLLRANGTSQYLQANKTKTLKLIIPQRANYLLFRPKAKYTLCYLDSTGKWITIGQKSTSMQIKPNDILEFNDVPSNALYLLIPEYSKGKERPFTWDNNGNINYW